LNVSLDMTRVSPMLDWTHLELVYTTKIRNQNRNAIPRILTLPDPAMMNICGYALHSPSQPTTTAKTRTFSYHGPTEYYKVAITRQFVPANTMILASIGLVCPGTENTGVLASATSYQHQDSPHRHRWNMDKLLTRKT
jgi:hypothetical protein